VDKERALRKGLNEQPKDTPGALAWLFRMFALLTSLFKSDLPELSEFQPNPDAPPEDQPFVVVAWTTSHAYARHQLAALGYEMAALDAASRAGAPIGETPAFYLGILAEPDEMKILGHVQSKDPEDVDFLIADMATKYKRQALLTLSGPGIAIRLNRRARRAALARVRRHFRREARSEVRVYREGQRVDRQERDRARRAHLGADHD
jgi:hypothetical protein